MTFKLLFPFEGWYLGGVVFVNRHSSGSINNNNSSNKCLTFWLSLSLDQFNLAHETPTPTLTPRLRMRESPARAERRAHRDVRLDARTDSCAGKLGLNGTHTDTRTGLARAHNETRASRRTTDSKMHTKNSDTHSNRRPGDLGDLNDL